MMEFDHPIQLRERYDELTCNPDGIELFKDEVLDLNDFANVFRRAVHDFIDFHVARGNIPPRSAYAVAEYSDDYFHTIQRHHHFTWGQMNEFLDKWEKDQYVQMPETQETSS